MECSDLNKTKAIINLMVQSKGRHETTSYYILNRGREPISNGFVEGTPQH